MRCAFSLLTEGSSNPKTLKGEARGYLTGILHLAPHRLAGRGNVCPFASKQCIRACLNKTGRGGIIRKGERTNAIQRARVRRTRLFFENRERFAQMLHSDISKLCSYAERAGMLPAVRLNGTSDLPFERIFPNLFSENPRATFYDYTKSHARMVEYLEGRMPGNYSLTFSRSENNGAAAYDVLRKGGNVAIVFAVKRGSALPKRWIGCDVIDGDASDLRFADPRGVIVGLRAKGKRWNADDSGFVLKI